MWFSERLLILLFCFCPLGPGAPTLYAQESAEPQTLFRQLQSPNTTDRAAGQLLKLGKSKPEARKYLATHLPDLIEKLSDPQVWTNAVQIAGRLKIAEAAPALAKWIGKGGQGTITIAQTMRLEDNPAAKALAEIGDPSLPTVSAVLKNGNLNERGDAVLVLYNIRSPAAQTTLRKHLKHETDPSLRDFIARILQEK